MRNETILQTARFDPRLPKLWLIYDIIALTVFLFTIPLIVPWLILGPAFHKKKFAALECVLTDRSLHIKQGVFFKKEKSIPLDKIQDVGMTEGPLLRRFGLALMRIETAGQSVQGAADARLMGIVDLPTFRDAILEQRDLVTSAGVVGVAAGLAAGPEPAAGSEGADLLREIRDSLLRIEERLGGSN